MKSGSCYTEVGVERTLSEIRNPPWVSISVSYQVSCTVGLTRRLQEASVFGRERCGVHLSFPTANPKNDGGHIRFIHSIYIIANPFRYICIASYVASLEHGGARLVSPCTRVIYSPTKVGVLSAMKRLQDHLYEGARPLAKRVLLQLFNSPEVADAPRDEARASTPLLRHIYDAAERVRAQVRRDVAFN